MKKLVLVALAGLVPTFAVHAQSFQENFDSLGAAGSTLNFNSFPDFTVTGNVDLVQSGDYGITCAGGSGKCIDLDGTTGPGGLTSSAIAYTAGHTFTISFMVSGNQRDASQTDDFSFSADFGQTIVFDGTCSSNAGCNPGAGYVADGTGTFTYMFGGADPFQTFTYTLTPYSSGWMTLNFGTTSHDNVGPILDNVSVSGAVPEPASWALMLSGFGLVGGAMRSHRKAAVSFG